ncbi:hypothetical protein [Legionella bononiensis]|uniref:Ran GTPase-activating protein (RanGAP) involved in mRNA processing and transport n=1 Tax=Legionella bononiensis TaxID=2793102 RepID=A0ABS1WEA8_9GAMM|nr:hypothetical protein [Legionella bononiensis]MBL7479428.1 hypothetical protein [Legionella bononiensis]MBL7527699.1 hypothetical protein [Legionella bononiensis]MBL7563618.1 hypothetical protein [Legionella bononiensis]
MRPELLEKITGNINQIKVNLADLHIDDDELLEVLNTIKQLKPTVTHIDLDNNNLGDKGAKILYEQLRGFNNIKELSLQFNHVGKEGAVELFGLKKTFPEIDILFHGNNITDVSEMDEIERLALEDSPRP